jgi:hypothetical protein
VYWKLEPLPTQGRLIALNELNEGARAAKPIALASRHDTVFDPFKNRTYLP